jgi:hypothetical protein
LSYTRNALSVNYRVALKLALYQIGKPSTRTKEDSCVYFLERPLSTKSLLGNQSPGEQISLPRNKLILSGLIVLSTFKKYKQNRMVYFEEMGL